MKNYDVVVIGGGPAGLSASLEASKNNAKVLLIEREEKLGGILKQCIHNGFGLITFKEQLSGPEYVERFIQLINESNVEVLLSTFVLDINKEDNHYKIVIQNQKGTEIILTNSIIFSTGCRERSAKQVFMQGDRVAGVMTAGLAQYYVNILGQKIGDNVVILGSGDIGLIMARRLTLEGAHVLGVYEIKPNPSGLNRNVEQCLKDFNIPLHLSTTVTKTFGKDRLEAIEVCKVDEHNNFIESTREIIKCDTLVLSVGLIPENELLEKLGVKIDRATNGALVDGSLMTNVDNIYACGNCLHVHDLVDYVSESSVIAGKNASKVLEHQRELININKGSEIFYVVPQVIDIKSDNSKTNIYFRVKTKYDKKKVVILDKDNKEIYSKTLIYLNPAEMIKLEVNLENVKDDIKIELI